MLHTYRLLPLAAALLALGPTAASAQSASSSALSRLSVGGYGEVAYSRNFYSDSYLRYSDPESKSQAKSHGRVDIPHMVIFLGYDFGRGWTMGSEIEFEHGGTESAVEIEQEEAGEYETEVERGGEVALEQFWIQKSFAKALNLRMGHVIVPVGQTNQHHLPTEFFGVYRPEGENTIMPCTWHETGLSLWGLVPAGRGSLRYEALLLPGLDSERFGSQGWIHDGSASPYEFKIANSLAGALRLDWMPASGLRFSLSGYVGNSFSNTLRETDNDKNRGVKGTVAITSVDFAIERGGWIVRGAADYGHLSDAAHISTFNRLMPSASPSPRQYVASDAYAAGLEAGYDLLRLLPDAKRADERRLYLFGRFDSYDSMLRMEQGTPYGWCGRQRIAAGVNYYPLRQIVVKAEYSLGLLEKRYNNEPAISLGVAYSGMFK